jgi:hypothetical protein
MQSTSRALLQDIELMPQNQDFGFQPSSRLEAVAQHTDAACRRKFCIRSAKPRWLGSMPTKVAKEAPDAFLADPSPCNSAGNPATTITAATDATIHIRSFGRRPASTPVGGRSCGGAVCVLPTGRFRHSHFVADLRRLRVKVAVLQQNDTGLNAGAADRFNPHLRTDLTLHLCERLLASALIARPVCLARTCHGRRDRRYRGCRHFTKFAFRGCARARRRLAVETCPRALGRCRPGAGNRRGLGVEAGLHAVDLLRARTGVTGRRRCG